MAASFMIELLHILLRLTFLKCVKSYELEQAAEVIFSHKFSPKLKLYVL